MQKSTITWLQEEASNAYNRVPQSEAAPFLQAAMLAEIALQLAKQNEHLEFIARAVDNSETFEHIASWLHAIADK